MKELRGPTSDRIRSGDIPGSAVNPSREVTEEEAPSVDAVRHASGQGMGSGATTARSGGAS